MVFMGVILHIAPGPRKAHNIFCRITLHLDLWDIGEHSSLSLDTVVESQFRPARTTRKNEETNARTFNSKVVNGNIRVEVRVIRGQGQSGVLFPGDIYSNTSQLVMDVPRYKHPVMRTQDLADPECSSFEEYEEDPDVFLLDYIYYVQIGRAS